MKTTHPQVIELTVVSDRPAFASEVRRAAGGADGVRVGVLERGAGPASAADCLALIEARPAAVLLIDAGDDPGKAILLAQGIFERQPTPRIMVAGPGSDPSLILGAQRAGASEYLPVPFDRESLLDALQRVWKRVAPEAGGGSRGRGRIATFLGSKGGCGTTTVAANLAVTLATQGHPTLLVDLDLSAGDLAILMDLTPAFGVPDVVQNVHRLDRELLNGMVLKHRSGLEVLCSGEDPERAGEVDPSRVAPVLAFLRGQFECVVVNARDAFDPLAMAAAQHSDTVHLVAWLDLLALRRAQWSLRRMSQAGIADDVLRLVINRYEKNPYISLAEAEKVLAMKVAWTIPSDPRAVRHALNEGIPAVSASRNGLSASFREYASRFAGQRRPAAPAPRRFLGLFPSARPVPAEGGVRS
jgi:pilus assembly protein CpaE